MATATKTKTAPAKNKPAHEIKSGSLKAVIWLNATEQGKKWYSTSFLRSYRTSDGVWKETSQMNTADLILLSKLAEIAHAWIVSQGSLAAQS